MYPVPSHHARSSVSFLIGQPQAQRKPPLFHLDQPATALFANYEKLARRVTGDLYREGLAEYGKLL